MEEVIVDLVLLVLVSDFLRISWLPVISLQKLISELWHHVELLQHADHVAYVAQVFYSAECALGFS